jgi:transposase
MYHIRVVNTASGARAVQVIYYINRKRKIFKHIGSAKNDAELNSLKIIAQDVIDNSVFQTSLFEDTKLDNLLFIDKSEFLGVYFSFLQEVFLELFSQVGIAKINNKLLLDLVIIRILEPCSKLRSLELLESYFGIKHRRQSYYESAPKWLLLKSKIESIVVSFAQKNYDFNYDLLFYDVTTLYFETFEEDELRRNGFSKENKSLQPQILIALMVTKEGFPIHYEIFSGNTFEGHTITPVIQSFIEKHKVNNFTVIADAAMISSSNVEEFNTKNINYIVGARLGNLSNEIINSIDKNLVREDGKSVRIKTSNGYLICSFSSVRYRKDKFEMQKQIEKAKLIVQSPSKSKKIKFTQTKDEKIEINHSLIEKTTKLLGIKGYCTNLEESTISNQTVIERYHELYKIEQAFRISKNDLQTRPIFHYKEEPIKLHLLVCFMALVISKHIELTTGDSIRKFITECKKITDARMFNKITKKEIRIRAKLNEKILKYINILNLSH